MTLITLEILRQHTLLGLELLGTAAFAVSGVLGAVRKKMDVVGIGACGFLAAFGGGTLRDVLIDRRPFFWAEHQMVLRDMVCNEIPGLFRDHRPYAICALAGGVVYALLAWLGMPEWVPLAACTLVTTGTRWLTLWLDWKLPAVDTQ